MSVEIKKIKSYPERRKIAVLADEIWHECYGELLGQGQVDYMVEKFGDELSIHPSGGIWMDSMHKTINKGVGVKALQEILGVTDEETIVCGDFYNDIPIDCCKLNYREVYLLF